MSQHTQTHTRADRERERKRDREKRERVWPSQSVHNEKPEPESSHSSGLGYMTTEWETPLFYTLFHTSLALAERVPFASIWKQDTTLDFCGTHSHCILLDHPPISSKQLAQSMFSLPPLSAKDSTLGSGTWANHMLAPSTAPNATNTLWQRGNQHTEEMISKHSPLLLAATALHLTVYLSWDNTNSCLIDPPSLVFIDQDTSLETCF